MENITFEEWHKAIVDALRYEPKDDEAAIAGRQGFEEGLSVKDVVDAIRNG